MLSIIPSQLYAQYNEDSLRKVWENEAFDYSRRMEAGFKLESNIHREGRYQEAFELSLLLLGSAKDANNKTDQIKANYSAGYVKWTQALYKEALSYIDSGYVISNELGDKQQIANGDQYYGLVFWKQGLFDQSTKAYYKALEWYESTEDTASLGSIYNNIGIIYEEQGDLDKALSYYEISLDWRLKAQGRYSIAISYTNIGGIHYMKKNYQTAIDYYQKALEIKKEINNEQGIAFTYNAISSIYLDRATEANPTNKDSVLYYLDTAEALDLAALEIQTNVGAPEKQGNSYMNLGRGQSIRGNANKAITYFMKAFDIGDRRENPKLKMEASNQLYVHFKKTGKYNEALEMAENYYFIRDSLKSEKNLKTLIQQEYQHAYEKQAAADSVAYAKEKEIAQVQIEKQDAELNAKRNQQYAMIGGLCMIGLFAGFMYNRFKVTRKQKGIIEDAHHELEEKNQEILDSITYAQRIQNAILPPNKLVKEYLPNSLVLYKPKDIVAGDFYWMEPQKDRILFAAADCTGHGVPGAMVSVICNNGLNRSVREFNLTDPAKILDKTRDIVLQEFEKSEEEVKDGMDIALCSLENDTSRASVSLKYAGAHNPLWVIRKVAEEVEEIKADKQPIGRFAEAQPFTSHEVELHPGDTFYIFSDGFADQFGGDKGKKFKTTNFKKLLLSIQNESMDRQRELIDEAFENWRGNLEQLDDVCVIGVRI